MNSGSAASRTGDAAVGLGGPGAALPVSLDLVAGRRQVPGLLLDGTLDDPNTGTPLAARRASAPDVVEQALATAHSTHLDRTWADAGVEGRAEVLLRLADELEARGRAMAVTESLNTGIVIGVTTPMASGFAHHVRELVEELRTAGTVRELPGRGPGRVLLRRDPWGPAVVVGPWNTSLPTAIGKSVAALAAGCPVILKPSEWAPSTSTLFADAVQAAGLPDGVFQLVHGDGRVGAQLVGDPRVRAIAMTGGTVAGRAVAASAAANFTRLQLELAGNNPAIIRADADLARTAAALASGMTKLNGQWCEGPGRVFVPSALHDELIEALLAELARVRIGPSTEPSSQMGPIAYRRHLELLTDQVSGAVELGARALIPEVSLPAEGWFMAPTVLTDLEPGHAEAEIFGPVVSVHRVSGDAEALALANQTTDGLAGFVFGADVEQALALGAHLRGGEIRVNGTSLLDLTDASHQSFWGTSGYGGHGAGEALEFFRGNRIVGVDNPDAPI